MITEVRNGNVYEYRGLEADKENIGEKWPLTNGSVYFAMDTSKLYIWDSENKTWILVA